MAKYDAGSAVSGAIAGASLGSNFGPWGTGAGALVGGVGSLFGSKKKKKKPNRLDSFDPQQRALYDEYINGIRGQGPMAGQFGFDANGYNQVFDQTVGRPAYRNFQENIVPQITGQFRGNNLQNSSYHGEALSRAGRNVQENLDALRNQNVFQGQQQAQNSKQNAINSILGMTTFNYEKPEARSGGIDQILNSVAPQAGEWFADYLKGLGSKTATPTTPAV